jgi:hypothetical protein
MNTTALAIKGLWRSLHHYKPMVTAMYMLKAMIDATVRTYDRHDGEDI